MENTAENNRFAEENTARQDVSVRWAKTIDAAALSDMNLAFNGCFQEEQAIRNALASNTELVAIAELDGVCAGFACAQVQHSFCYDKPEAFITELYVREGCRRRGAATILLKFLEQELCRRGADHVYLETSEGNAAARSLYEHQGYARRSHVVFSKPLAFTDR